MQPTFLIKKKITISNEYVYSKNKHKVSETHGQSKIKFSKKDFLEIFGENMTGKIFYNKNNIINFLNLVLERWKQIFFYNIENFKNPNLIKINSKIEEFKKNTRIILKLFQKITILHFIDKVIKL